MLYTFLLLLPCSVCLWEAVRIFCGWKNNTRSQKILAFCVLAASIFFFVLANYMAGITDYASYLKLDIIDAFVTPAIFPLMYLYFKSLTHETAFGWRDYIWFFPAFLLGFSLFFLYFLMDGADAENYLRTLMTQRMLPSEDRDSLYTIHYFISYRLYDGIIVLEGIGVTVYALVSQVRYRRRLRDFYSEMGDKSLNLDNAVLIWFVLSLLFAFGFMFAGGRSFWVQHRVFTMIYFAGWATVFFGWCYHGTRKKYSIDNLVLDLKSADSADGDNTPEQPGELPDKEEDSGLFRTGKYARLTGAFNKLIEEDRIYLQSNLRADEVARMIVSNRTYVSRMIKEEYRCSFSDYINRKRVEYAQQLMLLRPDMKQEDVAEKSGFLNASSLSRTFRQIVGSPPKEWLKKHSHSR